MVIEHFLPRITPHI